MSRGGRVLCGIGRRRRGGRVRPGMRSLLRDDFVDRHAFDYSYDGTRLIYILFTRSNV